MRRHGIVALAIMFLGAASSSRAADEPKNLSTADTRLVVGFEQNGISSSTSNQNFMLDFMLTGPAGKGFGYWFDARLASSPQTTDTDIKTFSGAFPGQLDAVKLGNFAQGLLFAGGLELTLNPHYNIFPDSKEYALEPLLIAGLGVQTPLNSSAPTAILVAGETEGMTATDAVKQAFPDINQSTTKYLALVPPNRDRFYTQWFVGLRLKTHHLHISETATEAQKDAGGGHVDAAFPGIIDMTLGQNENITGGRLTGLVGRIDAFYPFPLEGAGAALYVFGGINARFGSATESTPLILASPKSAVPVPGPGVAVEAIPPNTKDTWRIGVGLDMIALVSKLKGQPPAKP